MGQSGYDFFKGFADNFRQSLVYKYEQEQKARTLAGAMQRENAIRKEQQDQQMRMKQIGLTSKSVVDNAEYYLKDPEALASASNTLNMPEPDLRVVIEASAAQQKRERELEDDRLEQARKERLLDYTTKVGGKLVEEKPAVEHGVERRPAETPRVPGAMPPGFPQMEPGYSIEMPKQNLGWKEVVDASGRPTGGMALYDLDTGQPAGKSIQYPPLVGTGAAQKPTAELPPDHEWVPSVDKRGNVKWDAKLKPGVTTKPTASQIEYNRKVRRIHDVNQRAGANISGYDPTKKMVVYESDPIYPDMVSMRAESFMSPAEKKQHRDAGIRIPSDVRTEYNSKKLMLEGYMNRLKKQIDKIKETAAGLKGKKRSNKLSLISTVTLDINDAEAKTLNAMGREMGWGVEDELTEKQLAQMMRDLTLSYYPEAGTGQQGGEPGFGAPVAAPPLPTAPGQPPPMTEAQFQEAGPGPEAPLPVTLPPEIQIPGEPGARPPTTQISADVDDDIDNAQKFKQQGYTLQEFIKAVKDSGDVDESTGKPYTPGKLKKIWNMATGKKEEPEKKKKKPRGASGGF